MVPMRQILALLAVIGLLALVASTMEPDSVAQMNSYFASLARP
jgi:hypothetical protein